MNKTTATKAAALASEPTYVVWKKLAGHVQANEWADINFCLVAIAIHTGLKVAKIEGVVLDCLADEGIVGGCAPFDSDSWHYAMEEFYDSLPYLGKSLDMADF